MASNGPPPPPAARTDGPPPPAPARRTGRARRPGTGPRHGRADRAALALMLGVPALLVVGLVWLPAAATVLLSFTRWDGIGGLDTIEWIGVQNYTDAFTIYPPFEPALRNNLVWLVVLFTVPTLLGMFLAVLLDRELRGGSVYQSIFYLPVVLSLALIGFVWQLIYSRDQGLLNAFLAMVADAPAVDWFGNPDINLYAVLVAAGWRHTGYIMLLYLAGLKAVDPSLREAAAIDGAGPVRTFTRVVFPALLPINLVVVVVTVIDALRAFDIVWVINRGRNGLELISALVTSNVIGEASRVGFGSALAVVMLVISLVFIVVYVSTMLRGAQR
ncbi:MULTISPECIES: carbohydrate ABC transporter permease [Nocardiopsidaceae]|uniref:Sugar ABC transporter permease n=2 Tax=Nocardiopsidaceae TaxID=83676 RepID=A0ABY6YL97_9ACTN|nr:sugar ABC transporter permease [Streptomonospora nanhaiensis]WAE73112.1 sugar ABC transporter permease [Streptomonospora nanhaiensis]